MVEITIYKHLLTVMPALNRAIFYVGKKPYTNQFWSELFERLENIRHEIRLIGKMLVRRWGKKYLSEKLNGKKR